MIWLALVTIVLVLLLTVRSLTLNLNKGISGFVSASSYLAVSDTSGAVAQPASILAAQPGELTTRTTNTSGTLTMTNTSHGIVTGQRVDIYWVGGALYGAVVGTVSGTSVPIASVSSGPGNSNLPSNDTLVTVGIATSCAFELNGTNLSALITQFPGYTNSQFEAWFVFNDGTNDDYAILVQSGYIYSWLTGDSSSNPLNTYTPTKCFISHNNIAAAVSSLQAAALYH